MTAQQGSSFPPQETTQQGLNRWYEIACVIGYRLKHALGRIAAQVDSEFLRGAASDCGTAQLRLGQPGFPTS
jgi:hypothetical protein